MIPKVELDTEFIKAKRKEKKLTVAHMTKKVGYASPSSYSLIESGQTIPSPLRIKRIARELGVKPKELILHSKTKAPISLLEETKNIIPVKVDSSLPINQIVIDAGNGKRVTIQISVN